MSAQAHKLSVVAAATALTAIRSARLHHVGLAPTRDTGGSLRVTVAVPIDPSENIDDELEYALDAAQSYWPDCNEWSILQSDQSSESDSIPPDFVWLHSPSVCGSFGS